MRASRWPFLIVILAAFLTSPRHGRSQRPSGVNPPGPAAARPVNGRDHAAMFKRLSNGNDVWNRAEISNPSLRMMFDRMASRMGVTNGQITLRQYADYSEQRKQARSNSARPGGATPAGSPPAAGGAGGAAPARPGRPPRGGWRPPPPAGTPEPGLPPEGERRPVVYRAGKLPKGLPAWFQQLDTDRDGQVGLYEWKAAGRPVKEFGQLDQNQDGFLTPEEVLRHLRRSKARAGQASGGRPGTGRGGQPGEFR